MVSKWEQLGIEAKIIEILKTAHTHAPNHHFRRPYLSAYQLAIETQYLAQQLSLRIHQEKLPHVEGALLSDQHVKSMAFRSGEEEVHSSLAGFGIALSLFRYID